MAIEGGHVIFFSWIFRGGKFLAEKENVLYWYTGIVYHSIVYLLSLMKLLGAKLQ